MGIAPLLNISARLCGFLGILCGERFYNHYQRGHGGIRGGRRVEIEVRMKSRLQSENKIRVNMLGS